MIRPFRLSVFILYIVTLGEIAECRTIDLYEAVFRGPPTTISGQTDDLWGYSAALLNTENPYASSVFSEKISGSNVVIGGPRGSTGGPIMEPTGYVYVCRLNSNSTCDPANDPRLYDTESNVRGQLGGSDSAPLEEKGDQLMGFSMRSRNGLLVVCAPAWKANTEDGERIHGKCVQVDNGFGNREEFDPCTRDTRNNQHNILLNNETNFERCFSGVDVSITSGGSHVVMGAPGAFLFTGTGALEMNGNIAVSERPETPPLDETSFTGMAVARGHITDMQTDDIILGSPRAENLRGHVRVVNGTFETPAAMLYRLEDPIVVLPGDRVGTQFGLSITAADLTGDGYDELVVGAPFYFESAVRTELGAVYIFNNTGGNLTLTNRKIIVGEKISGRFGFSICALGDLDADGYDEVAISAPGGDNQPGTVFIYSGNGTTLMPVLSQTILGSQLNLLPPLLSGLTSFGSFVDGGTDIDGNYYNDLVIGAFESRKVFVLRSRTVALVTTSIAANPPTLNTGVTSFEITYCIAVSGKGFYSGQMIDVSYSLHSDWRPNGQVSRTVFAGNVDRIDRSMTVQVNSTLESNCKKEMIFLKNQSVDIQTTPIVPNITAVVPDDTAKPAATDGGMITTDLVRNRIYSVPRTSTVMVFGERECGRDDVCVFDLILERVTIVKPENGTALIGFTRQINISVMIRSSGPDNAYSPQIRLMFPRGLAYSGVSMPERRSCRQSTDTYVDCRLSEVLSTGDTTTALISLALAPDPSFANENITIRAEILPPVNSNDNETDLSNNNRSVILEVLSATDAVINVGRPIQSLTQEASPRPGGGLPRTLSELGRSVNVSFTAINGGPAQVATVALTVSIPYRNPCTKGSFLFYVGEVQVGSLECTSSPNVDVLGLYSGGASGPVSDILGDCDRSILRVDCATPGVQCINVTCPSINLTRNMDLPINVIGFIDDHYYSSATVGTILDISASIEITSPNIIEGETDNNQGNSFVEVRVNPETPAPPTTIEPWIIAVPIVIAVLLIGALFVVLYLCGFFKRKRPKKDEEKEELAAEGENGEGGTGEGENGEGGTGDETGGDGNNEGGTNDGTVNSPGTPL